MQYLIHQLAQLAIDPDDQVVNPALVDGLGR